MKNIFREFHRMCSRTLLITALLGFFAPTLFAQSGKVLDDCSFSSKILEGNRKFAIYLPPDYETSQRRYPALYLLHGGGDDHTGWVQFGEVQHIADQAIRAGRATPMIIVMPDANTDKRGYFNRIDGNWRFEDFFFEEFIPHVESQYRIKKDKQYRAVAGQSMGGGGTFVYALHHPEKFSSACPLSAGIGSLTLEKYIERVTKREPTALKDIPEQKIDDYYQRHSTLKLIEKLPDEQIKTVRWYIDCGDDDFLYEGNSLVHIALRKKGIPHEFRIRDGGHGWTYWRNTLPNVLEFVSTAFHKR